MCLLWLYNEHIHKQFEYLKMNTIEKLNHLRNVIIPQIQANPKNFDPDSWCLEFPFEENERVLNYDTLQPYMDKGVVCCLGGWCALDKQFNELGLIFDGEHGLPNREEPTQSGIVYSTPEDSDGQYKTSFRHLKEFFGINSNETKYLFACSKNLNGRIAFLDNMIEVYGAM